MTEGMKTSKVLIALSFMIAIVPGIFAQEESEFENPNIKRDENGKIVEVKEKVRIDTILYQSQYMPMLEELDALRREAKQKDDAINDMKREIEKKDREIENLKKPDLDDFLNMRDTSVFGVEFMVFPMDLIAPRSKDYYLLIQDIHDLSLLMDEIEGGSISQLSDIKDKLPEAMELIDKINSYASIENRKITDFLSEVQKQYFRDLVDRYNKLDELVNPN